MPSERLTGYLNGRRFGWFTRERGRISLTFDRSWVPARLGVELSASLIRSGAQYDGPEVENYLWGLLPDNDATLALWANRFGARANNPLSLLRHVGLDCAGAVQLTEVDDPTLELPGGIDSVTESEIAEHLRQLRSGSSNWTLGAVHEGQFSLAGAQAKIALRRSDSGWAVPWGAEPTTHIVKPGIQGLSGQDLNEHLCLDAGRRLGLNTVRSTIMHFEDQSAVVVERFDRRIVEGRLTRVHQEDLCQALGLHPAIKYQSEGGPGLVQSADLLRETIRGAKGRQAASDLLLVAAYNWLISASDAHAKNYALVYDAKPRLAPFYDIASTLPYSQLPQQKVKLAMSVGGRYRVKDIDAEHWLQQATQIGVDPTEFLERVITMNEHLGGAFRDAARGVTDAADRSFCDRLVDEVAARSASLARDLTSTARGSS